MSTHHKAIIVALENIPALYKEYVNFEKNLAGKENIKNKLSPDAYIRKVLDYEAGIKDSKNIKRRLLDVGYILEAAKPDFKLSYHSKETLQRYISAVGRIGVSERIQLQMELLELMEIKKSFSVLSDLLNETKIKELQAYLKGRK